MANAELVKLCVDVVKSPSQVQNYSKGKDVNAVIRSKFHQIMGTETPKMKDVRRHKVEIFEVMEEVLTETYLRSVEEDEFFMQFAETRNLALGDTQEFYVEDTGLVVVSEHAGNHWNISRQKVEGGASFSIATKSYAAAVYGDFFLFVTGRLEFGQLVAKVAEGIRKQIASEVAASFASASAALPAAFKGTGTYDAATLQRLVANVEAATGSNPIVVGTRAALAQVTAGIPQAMYSDDMKNEKNNSGRIRVVDGMTLVQLPQVHKANSFDFAYDDKTLLILPGNDVRPVKIVFEGDDWMKEVTDNTANADMSFEYKFMTKFGTKVIFDSLFASYTLA